MNIIKFVENDEVIDEKTRMGANFCQVDKIIQIYHLEQAITWGNQKWNGAAPILINILIINNKEVIVGEIKVNAGPEISSPAINKRPDPSACTKKYLIAASVSWFELDCTIRGIKDNKLISNPAHTKIQWEEDIVTRVPVTKVVMNSVVDGIEEVIKGRKEFNLSKLRLEV